MTGATAALRTFRRMPDFAGVALVDILANGVAMLIIVIVVSIAARMEREERQVEQASEVAAVMSHKFSTSLVLNSLAASPPARLHDYETSPLDAILDPEILPILELHGGFVREFYSGTIWTRRELLREHNGLSAWLAGFSDDRKERLRVDVYDVPQFYLTMSILREHGIRVHHWHFLTGTLSPGEAARCPPGVAAKDCPGGGAERAAPLPRLALGDHRPGGLGGPDSPLLEPPSGTAGRGSGREDGLADRAPDRTDSVPGPMPGGVVPGIAGAAGAGFAAEDAGSASAGGGLRADGGNTGTGAARGAGGAAPGQAGAGPRSGSQAAERDRGFGSEPGLDPGTAATLGSFPGARGGGTEPAAGGGGGSPRGEGRSGSGRPARSGAGRGGDGSRINLRIALPETIRRAARSGREGVPALEALFGIILHYLGGLQDSLDAGGTPGRRIESFAERIRQAFRTPPPITEAERRIARDLALKFALLPHLGDSASRPDPLAFRPVPPGPDADAVLAIAPNRLNDVVGVDRGVRRRGDGEAAGAERGDGRQGDGGRSGEGRGHEGRAGQAPRGDARDSGKRDRQPGLPDRGRAALALNAYPGIWKGLEIRIEPHSVLLMPPEVRQPERMRWRAVAYVTPGLDDFIVGFVFATVDPEGRLRIQADANRVRLDGRPLFTEYRESAFGSRGWLVSLYAALAAGLLLLGAARWFLAGRVRWLLAGRVRWLPAGRGRRLPAGRGA